MALTLPTDRVSFVAIDLECTGPAPGFDHITEVGAARFTVTVDGVVTAGPTFEQLVRPPRSIPPYVAQLTGITDEMVAHAPTFEAVWPRFVAFLDAEPNTLLLAHSARVDLSFLVLSADALGIAWEPPPTLCTVKIARRALPQAGKYGLMALVEHLGCGEATSVHHRALADALHARNVFARCVGLLRPTDVAAMGVAPTPAPALNELQVEIPERLASVADASAEGRPIWIVYRGGSKGRSRRRITPLGFYRREGRVFLRAFCHVDETAKSFRADRIGTVNSED
ncbi:MAG: exonuclease domain-containing protein [Myxococcota bacterium]|jgi:DNA polymerase-3 subunit epsilon|nr:exonuclease domain-containing protein [Myxococcota bacterium]